MVKWGGLMKLDYTGSQYVQLAKEQFCKIMSGIPFVSDVEIVSTGLGRGFGEFYADVHYEDIEETQRFCVDVKAIGEKRFVSTFIMMASQYNDDACYVFMAPYISEASAERLISNNYSFIDLSGNCYILSKRLFVHFKGNENKYVKKGEKKNYFSKSSAAASSIMRTLLDDPNRCWQVKSLAEITGKAIGMVSNVKAFLRDREWIRECNNGFKICDCREMLHTWAKDYHKKETRRYEFYSMESIAELEEKISEWSFYHDDSALLGGFSAAARYAPAVRYNRLDVYVEPQAFDEFIIDMELKPVESGGNIVVTIPHDETPYMFYREINGAYVTSPAQTIIDLLGNKGRGEEAAEAIISKEYSNM